MPIFLSLSSVTIVSPIMMFIWLIPRCSEKLQAKASARNPAIPTDYQSRGEFPAGGL
jgi:hypothetical protein